MDALVSGIVGCRGIAPPKTGRDGARLDVSSPSAIADCQEFAVPVLKELIRHHTVIGVITVRSLNRI